MFARWYTLHDSCPGCGFDIASRQPNTWAFIYISTAAISGLIVFVMLLAHPPNKLLGRALVLIAAIVLILFTLPYRKGLAIAMEYVVDLRWDRASLEDEAPSPPELEEPE